MAAGRELEERGFGQNGRLGKGNRVKLRRLVGRGRRMWSRRQAELSIAIRVTATFKGNARLWQQANSITAPVIVLDQTKQTLTAETKSRRACAGGFGECRGDRAGKAGVDKQLAKPTTPSLCGCAAAICNIQAPSGKL